MQGRVVRSHLLGSLLTDLRAHLLQLHLRLLQLEAGGGSALDVTSQLLLSRLQIAP